MTTAAGGGVGGTGFRCAVASLGAGEPLEGSASTVRAFLLLEVNGPWGVEAARDSRLPDDVKALLATLEDEHGVRPLLIRRPARSPSEGVQLFTAYVDRRQPWAETATLTDVREVLDLDVHRLGTGESLSLPRHDRPLFLVCTHGRHDACCAERGRPLAAALAVAAPEETWEVSHIGGDRFAANVLVLPHGLYYGRLAPDDAPRFAADHLGGRLDLVHLRGRSAYPFPVQAAEIHLRRHLGDASAAPLEVGEVDRQGSRTRVLFRVRGHWWEVRVEAVPGQQRTLTCRSARGGTWMSHHLVSITG